MGTTVLTVVSRHSKELPLPRSDIEHWEEQSRSAPTPWLFCYIGKVIQPVCGSLEPSINM